jgi:hypothetical protein
MIFGFSRRQIARGAWRGGDRNKKTARRRSFQGAGVCALGGVQRHLVLLTIIQEADASEADQQHREACLGFGDIAAMSRHAFSP